MTPVHRRTRAAVLLVVVALLAMLLPGSARAADAATQLFSADVAGDIVLAGNGLQTCAPGAVSPYGTMPKCEEGRARTSLDSTSMSNNDIAMTYIDADADPTTSNSSSSVLKLPADAKVLYAALTWSVGSELVPGESRQHVKFKAPGMSSYVEITSSTPGEVVDVTDLVAAGGPGTYWGADAMGQARLGDHAGWGLAVAFASASEPVRNLAIFKGPITVGSSNKTATFAINDISTPMTGTVTTRVGFVAFEGDRGFGEDSIKLGSKKLTDARNPTNDVFNSTHSDLGLSVGSDRPSYGNLLGTDIDRITVNNAIPNNATSTTLTLSTNTDGYTTNLVTFASTFYAPEVAVDPVLTDVDGGLLEPGDVVEVHTSAKNQGNEAATAAALEVSVPGGTTFVPGSATSTTGAAVETSGKVSTPLGASGAMAVGASSSLVFRVKVEESAVGSNLTSTATASYKGTTSTTARARSATSAPLLVQRPQADVSVSVTTSNTTAQVGVDTSASWEATVSNAGPSWSRPLTLDLTTPSGLTPATIDGCTGTCVISSLAPGASTAVRGTFALSDGSFAPAPVLTARTQALVQDTNTANNSAAVSVKVNRAPAAHPDTLTTTVAGGILNVLANDTDADGDVLVVASASANRGSASVVDGALTFAPTKGYRGPVEIDYVVSDGRGRTSTSTASVTVLNSAPTVTDEVLVTHRSSDVEVLANDTDADGDALSVTSASAVNGSVVLKGAGVLTYTPAAGQSGHDTITYVVEDGHGGSSTGRVGVSVTNAAPSAATDTFTTTVSGDLLNVLANDTDADSDTLRVTSASAAHGTAVLEAGKVRYTPTKGYRGADTVTYTITDGFGGNASGVVDVTVLNTLPVTSGVRPSTTASGTSFGAGDVTLDADGDAVTVKSVSADLGTATVEAGGVRYSPARGQHDSAVLTLTVEDSVGGTTSLEVEVDVVNTPPSAATDTFTTTVSGDLLEVLANDTDADSDTLRVTSASAAHGTAVLEAGKVRYTPTKGYRGADTVTYTITDGFGGNASGVVDVTVLNSAPGMSAAALGVTHAGGSLDLGPLVQDPDGDAVVLTSSAAEIGTASLDGTVLTYVPMAGSHDADTVTVTLEDSEGAVAVADVAVTFINTSPTTVAGSSSTTVSGDLLDVLASASDADGDGLSVTAASATHGAAVVEAGKVRYTPTKGYRGTATVTYTVTDGFGGDASGVVNVTVLNTLPVLGGAAATVVAGSTTRLDVLASASDADGDDLGITSTQAHSGSVSVDGTALSYTAPATAGSDRVDYEVADGFGGSAQGHVEITVTAAPTDPPTGPVTPPVTTPPVTTPPVVTPPVTTPPVVTPPVTTPPVTDPPVTAPPVTAPPVTTPPVVTPPVTAPPVITPPVVTPPAAPEVSTPVVKPSPRPSEVPTAPVDHEVAPSSIISTKALGEILTSAPSVAIDVLHGATSTSGRTLEVVEVETALYGTVVINDGVLVYTPTAGWYGKEVLTYVVSDGVTSLVLSVTVVVEPALVQPAAVVPVPAQAPVRSETTSRVVTLGPVRSSTAEVQASPLPRSTGSDVSTGSEVVVAVAQETSPRWPWVQPSWSTSERDRADGGTSSSALGLFAIGSLGLLGAVALLRRRKH